MLLGKDSPIVASGRAVTMQALGGTGELKIGADFLKHLLPQADVFISDPTWANHRALLEGAGFKVYNYPYYDAANHGLHFVAMLVSFTAMPAQHGTAA